MSARTRLATIFLLLFVSLGTVLLVINYRLLDEQLPTSGHVTATALGPSVGDEGPGSVVTAASAVSEAITDYRRNTLSELVRVSGLSLLAMSLLATAVAWIVARRVLRPLQLMNESARRISEQNLTERLPVSGPRDELRDLGETINQTLDRIQAAFEHERRLVANASHELGTPIANQRILLEVALDDPDASAEELRAACRTTLVQTERTQELLEGMLTLARAEHATVERSPVRLDRALQQTLDANALDRLEVQTALAPVTVLAEPFLVDRLVANLVANAGRHNIASGWVRLETMSQPDGSALLRVTNSAEPIDPADLPELTQPFRRASGDRIGSDRSNGLGLSIVDAVVRAHRWSLDLTVPQPAGFAATVRIPASDVLR